jgi:hypothetical protein
MFSGNFWPKSVMTGNFFIMTTMDILEDYDIRAFPTYFLIGPDGGWFTHLHFSREL